MPEAGGHPTRRVFLQAAAFAAAPLFVPRSVLGSARRWAASERLAIGIIGMKNMGSAHIGMLLPRPDVHIVALCDVDAGVRTAAKKRVEEFYSTERGGEPYRGCEIYNEYEALLARTDIDAVVIATPDHWHAIITIAACRAGKDVYCEKPLSLTIRDAREMVSAARRYGRIVQTGSQQRSEANFRHACELVRNGLIGDLKTVHVECGGPSWDQDLPTEAVPAGLDFERWLGPAPSVPCNKNRLGSTFWTGWRRYRDYSGGKMTDWGAHHFDIAQWGLGMDQSGPVEIIPPPRKPGGPSIESWRPKIVEGAGADPNDPSWGLTYRYANGVEVIKDGRNGVRFVGSKGWVEVNRGHLATSPASLKSYKLRPSDIHLTRSDNHHQNWIDCIRSRRRPIADVEIGCRSVSVCHLGNIALWLGRPIRWDAASEQIIGDEQAARMLSRPKRSPYGLFA